MRPQKKIACYMAPLNYSDTILPGDLTARLSYLPMVSAGRFIPCCLIK